MIFGACMCVLIALTIMNWVIFGVTHPAHFGGVFGTAVIATMVGAALGVITARGLIRFRPWARTLTLLCGGFSAVLGIASCFAFYPAFRKSPSGTAPNFGLFLSARFGVIVWG